MPLAIGLALGSKVVPARLLVAGVFASIIPDADVLAFRLDIPYDSVYGHRGFTHSVAFAFTLGLIGACFAHALRTSALTALMFIFAAAVSHGVLDSFTNGGHGIAFLWPWSTERFFAQFEFIEVSPIGVTRFFTSRGVAVLRSELVYVWLPCALAVLTVLLVRRGVSRS
ncbi:MAG: metal-dependent hydrolase [Betaproteobacteria bacterium]|nr:metal-dependent hydrolase [Betaproteobacteria bacterium]